MIGASNWSADRIREANEFALANGLTPFAVTEVNWALAVETPAFCMFPESPFLTEEERKKYLKMGMPILAWASQAGGVITKVLLSGWERLPEDLRRRYDNPVTRRRIENVRKVSGLTGISPTAIALAYITCSQPDSAALICPSTIEHMDDSMSARDLCLSDELRAMLTEGTE